MRLGEVIRKWRMMSELSIRDAAAMIGTSATTLHRLESGDDVDGRTLIAVLKWLMAHEKESSTSDTGVVQDKEPQADTDESSSNPGVNIATH